MTVDMTKIAKITARNVIDHMAILSHETQEKANN